MMRKSLLFFLLLLLLPLQASAKAPGVPSPLSNASASWPALSWKEKISPIEPHHDCFLQDNGGYHDDSLDIRIETFRQHDTTVMACYITLQDVSQFRTGTANTTTVERMAQRFHAVLCGL